VSFQSWKVGIQLHHFPETEVILNENAAQVVPGSPNNRGFCGQWPQSHAAFLQRAVLCTPNSPILIQLLDVVHLTM
jgi:hypothetical protein